MKLFDAIVARRIGMASILTLSSILSACGPEVKRTAPETPEESVGAVPPAAPEVIEVPTTLPTLSPSTPIYKGPKAADHIIDRTPIKSDRLIHQNVRGNLKTLRAIIPHSRVASDNARILQELGEYEGDPLLQMGRPTLEYADMALAMEVQNAVRNHPVTRFEAMPAKYDPGRNIGFCFGRALASHLDLIARGVNKARIKKVWIMGAMRWPKDDIEWGFHVATMVKGPGNTWLVIDPAADQVREINDWFAFWQKIEIKNDAGVSTYPIRMFVTDAKRWSTFSDLPYWSREFKNPFYNDYFVDFLLAMRKEGSISKPDPEKAKYGPILAEDMNLEPDARGKLFGLPYPNPYLEDDELLEKSVEVYGPIMPAMN